MHHGRPGVRDEQLIKSTLLPPTHNSRPFDGEAGRSKVSEKLVKAPSLRAQVERSLRGRDEV
jgi:hypothetical protein